MEEMNRIKKEEEDVQHRSQSPVLEQILGVPKHLGGFEAQSLAELEGLSTAFTPLKKDQHPSASSLDDLTLEGLGIEESEPVTESAMKPSKNEMEKMKKLAKQQKKEREAAKKLKAERERREKKQAKALGGSSIANLLGKAADKKSAVSLIKKDDPTAAAVAFVNNEKPPKTNICAYLHFIEEKRACVKEGVKRSHFKKSLQKEVTFKDIWPNIKEEHSRRWDFEMSETDKIPYFKMAADDKDRYEKEMKEYVLRSGEGGNGHAPCEALDDVKEEKTEAKITERRELNVVRKEITATLRGIEDSFDLVFEDAENKKKGAYENAEKFLRELRAILARMSIVI